MPAERMAENPGWKVPLGEGAKLARYFFFGQVVEGWGGGGPPPPPLPLPPRRRPRRPLKRFESASATLANEGRGRPPIRTVAAPFRIMPGVPVGGIIGWSVPICLLRAM